MTNGLDDILREFPYEPGRLNARLAKAADGREVLQIRVELGILQMECVGRPDGGPSLLEAAECADGPLSPVEAAAIRLELVQHHQRTVAFLTLGEAGRALADADLLLRGADLLGGRGPAAEAEWAQGAMFSAIVLRTRAAATASLASGRVREAAAAVDAGIEALRSAADRSGIDAGFDGLADVVALRALRESCVPQLPPSLRNELEVRLRAAIASENFELAAILRDELRRL